MRRLLLFPLLAAAACRAAEPAITQERVVLATNERPAGEPTRPPEWFDREIAAAEAEMREGRLEEALARVTRARAERPAEADARDLDDLMRRLNQAVLDLPTLEASAEPERDPIAFGDPVRVRLRLRNAGDRPVRVPVAQAGGSASLFVLDVVRREYDVRANVVTSRRRIHHPLRRALDLPPGAASEIVITLPRSGNERPLEGFRTYTVGGQLRAGVVEVGGLRRYEAVRIRPGRTRSFRPNYEHLADDPIARVRQALERNAPLHLLTASALVPPARRGEAVDALVASLRGGGPMDFAAYAALEYLTEVSLGHDADAWRAWWPRVRERYFEAAEGEGPGEGPRFGNAIPPEGNAVEGAEGP